MVMNPLVINVAKATLKFFLIGAVFAFCAPYLGAMIGLAPTVAAASGELGKFGDPVLLGLAFAVIGALDALVKPVFQRVFKSPPAPEKLPE